MLLPCFDKVSKLHIMPSFTTKQATTSDISLIRDLQEKIWYPTYLPILSKDQVEYMFELMYSYESLKEQIDNQKHTFILLYQNDTAIGFASYSKIIDTEIYKIHKIYVLPEAQGTGAGKFLIQTVIQQCEEKKAVEIRLNVNRYNKARFFYEKTGFVVLYEEDIPVGPYLMNDYIMSYKTEKS